MARIARLEIVRDDRVPIARIEGDIDISNTNDLGEALLEAVGNKALGLVLDLSDVSYLDSAGVHLILRLGSQLKKRRQELRAVVLADAPLKDVLEVSAVDKLVPLHVDAAEASAAIRRRPDGGD